MEPTSSTPAEERPEEVAPARIDEPQPEPTPDDLVAEAPAVDVPAVEPEAAAAPEPFPPAPEPPAPSALDLGDAAPAATVAPDLSAVEAKAPVEPAPATNLDLPSLELPNPVPPAAPVAPTPPAPGTPPTPYGTGASGAGYTENLARQSYGVPAPQPAPPSAGPYADSPYAASAEPQYAQPEFGQQPAAPSPYGQPGYGQQQYGQLVPATSLSPADESTWVTAAHWSSLVAGIVGLPFLGPLLVMLIQGPKSARVRAQAVESLNFDLTMLIGMLVSFVLMVVLIGFITAPILGVLWLVLKIVATVQTASGQDFRYPLNIRMVK